MCIFSLALGKIKMGLASLSSQPFLCLCWEMALQGMHKLACRSKVLQYNQ